MGAWSAGLSCLLVCVVLFSAAFGPVRVAPLVVAEVLLNAVALPVGIEPAGATGVGPLSIPLPRLEWASVFDFAVPATHETIVMRIRLPRVVLAATVGFALAAAGTVMQGFFRNPMADPSIVGVSSGAALGAVASIVLPLPLGLRPMAFLCAILTAFAVYLIASEGGRTPVATLLLAGVAIQTFLGAMISYLQLSAGESLEQVVYWLMGHLHASTWTDVRLSLPVVIPLFVLLVVYAGDLNVLLLGEEDAQSLGIEVERTKRLLLAAASVITAAGVAVSGVIGFVGLIVPHVMRLLVGPDHRILLPTSALAGSVFLVATDTVARAGPAEVPVGIVTAALGAPFFLYLLRTREVHAL
ncbi:corrinoid ABC transporter permease [Halalkalicoccus jeotgali B3]|uniref:Cobalamin import system permease protein BtuC n=1 Tax=Halalkalicoccus jeotgali (strain DSM 18796 / CECT 7217 / JCM 14584 / KCTC 4019 / B3) TaxID=795797 RepID=D8J2R8_HALJB|nr:vitamin B12 ABC transporter permease BtuC [Halalkalicoccus jeotgali]ADJ15025.1 corrinoid ABC transporter permease [Halalkalicoccus jeotgali B3]ELY34957.1 corrinoid ABC transporter permease [Halalkalicoccus jeotgali B3]